MKIQSNPFALLALSGGVLLTGSVLADAQQLYTLGHGDIGLGEGTELEPHVHLSAGAVVDGTSLAEEGEYEPDELLIFVPDSTFNYISNAGGRPLSSDWDPLGVASGENFWFLPETNAGDGGAATLGAPFLGIGGEEIDLGTFDDNVISLTLTGANLPSGGVFSIWSNSGFGPDFYMSTADGISALDTVSIDLDLADHGHYNFGFSTAGLYELEFEVSAFEGGVPVSASGTYSFLVSVPEPGSTISLIGLFSLGLIFLRRRL